MLPNTPESSAGRLASATLLGRAIPGPADASYSQRTNYAMHGNVQSGVNNMRGSVRRGDGDEIDAHGATMKLRRFHKHQKAFGARPGAYKTGAPCLAAAPCRHATAPAAAAMHAAAAAGTTSRLKSMQLIACVPMNALQDDASLLTPDTTRRGPGAAWQPVTRTRRPKT